MLQMILIYLGVLLLLLYYFLTRNHNYWESKGIPFEKPFFIFGNLYDVVRGKQNMTEKIRNIYLKHKSPYVGIHVFTNPQLMVRSPYLLKKILVKDFDKFINRPIASVENIDPIGSHSLLSAKDATWRNLRAKISPVFTSGKMKLMLPLIRDCTKELLSYLKKNNGNTLETEEVFKKFSVDIISSCAFGINSNCLKNENSEILRMANQLLDSKSLKRNISVFSYVFLPSFVKIFRLTFQNKEASDFLIDVFERTMEEREKLKVERNDLIDLLYSLRKNESFADKYKFDKIKMAAQAIVFFSCGNDAIAVTLVFTCYELALDTDIQSRLREELLEKCDENCEFSYETLQNLKYLDMVLKETHRKYPLVPFLIRETATDYVFEETGLALKKGDRIFIPLPGLHYDPEYFPDPDKFDPERFNDDNKRKIPSYTYMPFGEGPRACIGERFANLVTKLALAYVVLNFQIEKTDLTPIPLKLSTTSLFLQSEGGLNLKMIEIKS